MREKRLPEEITPTAFIYGNDTSVRPNVKTLCTRHTPKTANPTAVPPIAVFVSANLLFCSTNTVDNIIEEKYLKNIFVKSVQAADLQSDKPNCEKSKCFIPPTNIKITHIPLIAANKRLYFKNAVSVPSANTHTVITLTIAIKTTFVCGNCTCDTKRIKSQRVVNTPYIAVAHKITFMIQNAFLFFKANFIIMVTSHINNIEKTAVTAKVKNGLSAKKQGNIIAELPKTNKAHSEKI